MNTTCSNSYLFSCTHRKFRKCRFKAIYHNSMISRNRSFFLIYLCVELYITLITVSLIFWSSGSAIESWPRKTIHYNPSINFLLYDINILAKNKEEHSRRVVFLYFVVKIFISKIKAQSIELNWSVYIFFFKLSNTTQTCIMLGSCTPPLPGTQHFEFITMI